MFHQTDIRTLLPGMTPFPADVFSQEQPWLAQHLLPLIGIDLGILRPETGRHRGHDAVPDRAV